MSNQPIEEKWKETLRRDWDTDALGEDDYGCDGASDNCCGNCSGWTPSIEKFESFIENLLEQEKRRMSEEIEGLHKRSAEFEDFSSATVDEVLAIINK